MFEKQQISPKNCENGNNDEMQGKLTAVSLFSCIGVAECYLSDLNIDVLVASDIDKRRCEVHKFLYPNTKVVCGDITSKDVKDKIIRFTPGKVDVLISTPPCQGMSSVGKNRKLSSLTSKKDKRNNLILESFPIIDALEPTFVLFENVPRLLRTTLTYEDADMCIEEILRQRYGSIYDIKIHILNVCDYGIPQNRERVFIALCKKGHKWSFPEKENEVVTLRQAIGSLPSIEAGQDSGIKNHWARKHPSQQVMWMSHTPTGCSAFDNDVYYPKKANGERVKGFHNCYKRVEWDKPSPTITMRNEIMSSQDKVHPGRELPNGLWSDARVLTLRELLIVMSMPPDLSFPTNISDTALRQYIGEGIPPLMVKKIFSGIC